MNKGKLIGFLGSPASGKSTLASAVHTKLKMLNANSIFVGEVATNYIAEYGVPTRPMDQMVIFYKQLEKERMFIDSKEIVVCDSSSILNYFYFRGIFESVLSKQDIAAINHIQKEILRSISDWDKIYYLPPFTSVDVDDGIRFQNKEQIEKIDRMIKNYLDLENIPHVDLTKIPVKNRVQFIINDLGYDTKN